MSITSANAVYQLAIANLFPTPVQLQGFGTDDAFDTDSLESAETMMGVDGKLSGGFVYVPTKQTITLQADSASNSIFDTWWSAAQGQQDVFVANGLILLPALGKKWTFTKGFLTGYSPVPPAKKILQPRKFGITWERVSPAAI
jgi:hypothetical protein